MGYCKCACSPLCFHALTAQRYHGLDRFGHRNITREQQRYGADKVRRKITPIWREFNDMERQILKLLLYSSLVNSRGGQSTVQPRTLIYKHTNENYILCLRTCISEFGRNLTINKDTSQLAPLADS